MKIVNEDDRSVTVYVYREGYLYPFEVIKLAMYQGDKWSVGSSSCLPSDIDHAREYLEAMNAAFKVVDKIIKEKHI